MKVLVWLTEGTWEACVDAAGAWAEAADITLLHVVDDRFAAGWAAASGGLLGRAGPPVGAGPLLDAQRAFLDAAALRLGVPARREARQGLVEREVVTAAASADLLVCARDGGRSVPGPHSLSHATRFVVDHAQCAVLLVWPGAATLGPPHPRA